MSVDACDDIGVAESDIKAWRVAVVLGLGAEVGQQIRVVVLNGAVSVDCQWTDLLVPIRADIAPDDAVLDFVLGLGCHVVDAAVPIQPFVLDDGAVVEVGSAFNVAAPTSFSRVVVDKATPKRGFGKVRNATAQTGCVVVDLAVGEMAWTAVCGTMDAATVFNGCVVMDFTTQIGGVAAVADGTAVCCLVSKELAVFYDNSHRDV